MKTEWNLNVLYEGVDSPEYTGDVEKLAAHQKKLSELVKNAPEKPDARFTEDLLVELEEINRAISMLMNYLGLRTAVNTSDTEALAQQAKIARMYSEGTADMTAAEKILGSIGNADELAVESGIIAENRFIIENAKRELSHMLANDTEAIIAAMDETGGSAWGRLQSFLTSSLTVDYGDEKLTLSEVRNLAYSDDPETRKKAYYAELASYEKVKDSVAFAINNIKNQVTMLCKKRGYGSPLAMTLEYSRMKRETLDAMMSAIEEYLPVMRKYLKCKAKKLGYEDGLPWYELFAPVGKEGKTFTPEEAGKYLSDCFDTLSPDVSEMMREAFANEWIDFYPKKGKEGGAFCSAVPEIKQSRILTNFDGTFGSVDTLAHELGHAFHDMQVENERPLNRDYPMPVAETASTFNEVHLGRYAIERADEDEKAALLDSALRENIQCVVDIYSRYLFETAVFENCTEKFLMADDLCEMMLDCQKKAYGDGLDEKYLHPYMWLCKGHYYSSGLSFYNFPYAFGNLFAQGLYGLFLERGESFMKDYREMLRKTPVHTMEENGAMMGIDLTDTEFWKKSLSVIAEQIDRFCDTV